MVLIHFILGNLIFFIGHEKQRSILFGVIAGLELGLFAAFTYLIHYFMELFWVLVISIPIYIFSFWVSDKIDSKFFALHCVKKKGQLKKRSFYEN